jgi:hypothetical protein
MDEDLEHRSGAEQVEYEVWMFELANATTFTLQEEVNSISLRIVETMI